MGPGDSHGPETMDPPRRPNNVKRATESRAHPAAGDPDVALGGRECHRVQQP